MQYKVCNFHVASSARSHFHVSQTCVFDEKICKTLLDRHRLKPTKYRNDLIFTLETRDKARWSALSGGWTVFAVLVCRKIVLETQ